MSWLGASIIIALDAVVIVVSLAVIFDWDWKWLR